MDRFKDKLGSNRQVLGRQSKLSRHSKISTLSGMSGLRTLNTIGGFNNLLQKQRGRTGTMIVKGNQD